MDLKNIDTSMDTRILSNMITDDFYKRLNRAHEDGHLVAWSTAMAAQEFLTTMGVLVAYPENFSATLAAKGYGARYIAESEKAGFSNDICSYAGINLGYIQSMHNEEINIPKPDFLVTCNTSCDQLSKWFENVSYHFNVPIFCIDMPTNYSMPALDNRIDYIVDQFKDFVHQLEIWCNKPFDYDKYAKVMRTSIRASQLWMKSMGKANNIPSPMDGYNIFNYLATIVTERGIEDTAEFYNLVDLEMQRYIEENKSQFKGEQKYRILWEGIACWPYLAHNYKQLKKNNVLFTSSMYPLAWDLQYEMFDIRSMARAYSKVYSNCGTEFNVATREKMAADGHCDGIIYNMNRSCKIMSMPLIEQTKLLYEKNGLPYMIFDGDQGNPNNFSQAQFETRLQALVEEMEARKNEQEGQAQ
ncbi:MAG: 2-hydroxyacyl-CoA dehydratase family protein [Clostridiales bacterium]|nr:2-hydroxyacyl-CoA dehydratase family protein [Clostridiales bacterium]